MASLLHTGTLPTDIIAALEGDFDGLKPSVYKDGSYRLRRYSKIVYNKDDKHIDLLRGTNFCQSSEFNKFQGDVVREYDDISDELIASEGFLRIVDTFANEGGLPKDATIDVHQIRVVAKDPAKPTVTTPEGIHQDGYNRIGMFTVSFKNAEGAELRIYSDNDPDTVLEKIPSKTGGYCVVDDSDLWHYATEISSDDGNGYWDLFVLTANMN
ncbi:2OG-Fe dioxygenase family protein [Moraxella nasovis]|uniref:2OG-Fe dioxygenase family protein n=1 Tax=Moraxella nasovis TaxID=2904121 RepID=UPI001F61AC8F|nr:2OG-Fe dioxygenase family protein [Moraxella nasovis]UNU73922.1 2OG-Fe dioxygenase family protein [Moraxella nasovis]